MSLPINEVICGDCLEVMKDFPDNSVDLVVTDPPYGYSFMGKDWDKAVPSVDVWRECLRVLKPGAWCLVMSAPRQDVLSRMIVNLSDAGFRTDFTSIYWAYASGFPKAGNISKLVDKRVGVKREVTGNNPNYRPVSGKVGYQGESNFRQTDGMETLKDIPATPEAQALDGSYAGFQPKPAVEVILICMKPLSENTYVDQALKNGKGITWLDDCRIPYESEDDEKTSIPGRVTGGLQHFGNRDIQPDLTGKFPKHNTQGRFPANLLVSDDVLNDGRERHKAGNVNPTPERSPRDGVLGCIGNFEHNHNYYNDNGSFSRYFDLDAWARENGFPEADIFGERQRSPLDTFPFLIVPKASKSEKNKGLEGLKEKQKWLKGGTGTGISARESVVARNNHPTVKPLKLMRYLITLTSRPDDVVLDIFCGSGTTLVAAKQLGRRYIGIEIEPKYVAICNERLKQEELELEL